MCTNVRRGEGTYSSSPTLLVFLVGTMVNGIFSGYHGPTCSTASEEEISNKFVSCLNTNIEKNLLMLIVCDGLNFVQNETLALYLH